MPNFPSAKPGNGGGDTPTGGDMLKSVYDTNDNGIVDKVETVPTTTYQQDELLKYNAVTGKVEGTGITDDGTTVTAADRDVIAKSVITEANSIEVGPSLTISSRGGFAEFESNVTGNKYLAVDSQVDSAGSTVPTWARRGALVEDVLINNFTGFPESYTAIVLPTSQEAYDVHGISINFINALANFRMVIYSSTTSEIVGYYPDRLSSINDTGVPVAAGLTKLTFQDPLALPKDTALIIDLFADEPVVLDGNFSNPYLLVDRQSIDSFDMQYEFEPVATRKLFESSTRIKSGFLFVEGPGNNFTIGAGELEYFDPTNYTTDEASASTVAFAEQSGLVPSFTLPDLSYVIVTSTGGTLQRNRPPTNSERRSQQLVAVLAYDGVNILQSEGVRDTFSQVGNQLIDFMQALGNFKVEGLELSPNGANLKLDHSAGEIFGESLNWIDQTDPHTSLSVTQSPIPNITVYLGDGTLQSTGTNDVFPTEYNPNGGSTFVTLGGGANTSQIVQIYIRPATNEILYLAGQEPYNSISTAIEAFPTYRPIVPDIVKIGTVKIGSLIIRKGATDLADELVSGDLVIVDAEKFGDINPLARTGSDIEPTPVNRHFVYYDAALNKLVDSGDVALGTAISTDYTIPNTDWSGRYVVEPIAADVTILLPGAPNANMRYEFINSKRFNGGWGVSGFNVIITWSDGVDDYFVTLDPDPSSGLYDFESYLVRYDFNKWGITYNG